ncbi:glycosyltransferase [Christiangramia echinicola]|uniref:glycosyltransferase n=1 Tax=Christiangramia echinicola TaxID=279359 RepID=UPI000424260E|nr:glycosyltransferase [Christiangramia echinicola]
MKIVFLCGSLEPGKNGVGDYVNRLAGCLLHEGVKAYSIALNDHFIEGWQFDKFYHGNKIHQVLRFGKNLCIEEKINMGRDWIEDLEPDWISLQYVPYSFNKKGIPLLLNKELEKLGRGHNWHIMFHELWAGMGNNSSIKLRIYGFMQKFIIQDLLKSLKPRSIHTHATIYRKQLQVRGWEVCQLPLFGNIRFYENGKKPISDKRIKIAVFGCIQPEAKLIEFICWLRSQNLDSFCFHFLGNNGNELDSWLEILEESCIEYKLFGWLEEKELSIELSNCDLGITSTPYYLVEKSGSVAAMIEHKMNIICIGAVWIPKGLKIEKMQMPVPRLEQKLRYDEICSPISYHKKINIENVASKFLTDLQVN